MEAITNTNFIYCGESQSTGDYDVIKLLGDTVAWKSHKQITVSKSTCEASVEIVSLNKAIRDIIGKTMYLVSIWNR